MRCDTSMVLTSNVRSTGPTTPFRRLFEISDYILPFTVRALARVGVSRALAEGPHSVEALVCSLGLNAQSLRRALLLLASRGLIVETDRDVFARCSNRLPQAPAAVTCHSQLVAALHGTVTPWATLSSTMRLRDGGSSRGGFRQPLLDSLTQVLDSLAEIYAEENDGQPHSGCSAVELDWVTPVVLRAVCESGALDRLRTEPSTASRLAEGAGLDPTILNASLRLLATRGLVGEPSPASFTKTPLSALLTRRGANGLREVHPLIPSVIQAWGEFHRSLVSGGPAFYHVHGMSLWDYLVSDPEATKRFSKAMSTVTRLEMRAMATAYPWSRLRTVVDVGGGDASTSAAILRHAPNLYATTVDLPYLHRAAVSKIEACGLTSRASVVDADFFHLLPRGADAYLIKRVLYGWPDREALKILSVVRSALRTDSIVLIAEPMFGAGAPEETILRSIDLLMLGVDGGRVRTVDEVAQLLNTAGLEFVRIITTPLFPLIEARPA